MNDYTCNVSLVVLDDGEYFIELNPNMQPAEAPGFLQQRWYVGVTTPGGYECIGSFERHAGDEWEASIDTSIDDNGSDSRRLGRFAQRLDAIVTLWTARHDALCRHRE